MVVWLWRARLTGEVTEKAFVAESKRSTLLRVPSWLLPPVTSALPDTSAVTVCRVRA
ncbi:hypothetical protein ACLEPN_32110 [Myxococcus sp. 1LA]